MYHIRKVKTGSGKTAVQIIRYANNKRIIEKHIGSGQDDNSVKILIKKAEAEILKLTKQGLIEENIEKDQLIDNYEYIGINYRFSYEILEKIFTKLGFDALQNDILKDFTIIRIFEPASKLRSIELHDKYFGIKYTKTTVFRKLKKLEERKDDIQDIAINFARNKYGFKFSVVFYDITTLYFEAFKEDELRKCGFSKDNKFNQPQILIALITTDTGFPISYEVIEGNKFEGHTILPFITRFRDRHKPETLTVVADAAMISKDNIEQLIANNLKYIVGARLGNLSLELIEKISKELNRNDARTFRLETKLGHLICQFSQRRYRKDRKDMDKQIERAKENIKKPKSSIRVCKFIKKFGNLKYEFNKKLEEKTKLLLGIKGYYTNLEIASDQYVIDQYRNLWKIEKAFRIAKSDLIIRPIYHFRKKTIEAHILICFVALCISKYIEIETRISLKKFLDQIKHITEAIMENRFSGKTKVFRLKTPDQLQTLLTHLLKPH
jgi:transposase